MSKKRKTPYYARPEERHRGLWETISSRRRWATEIDDCPVEITWIWDFRSVELKIGDTVVLEGAGHSALTQGVCLHTSLGEIELKLSGSSDSPRWCLKLSLLDRPFVGPAAEIVDLKTRLMKRALFVGAFGLAQLIPMVLYPALSRLELMFCWSAFAVCSAVFTALVWSGARLFAGLTLGMSIAIPAIFFLGVGTFFVEDWVPRLLVLILPGLLFLFRDIGPALETWRLLNSLPPSSNPSVPDHEAA